ncbi:MAG TPA: PP2C family serine/threonine-protein phosphatase [Candidatus Eremiobacteraeota bacterium]|nr:MAG: hypothetical protein BWY64_03397 [bacterium ADurb.Bin363]HPZ06527.1 PP2C family serine/threonine-protein phosphatase [Candidatus Eremiobacteraeota bacterium]
MSNEIKCPRCGFISEGNFCVSCGTDLKSIIKKEEIDINEIEEKIIKIFNWLCHQSPQIQISRLCNKVASEFSDIDTATWEHIRIFLKGFKEGSRITKRYYRKVTIRKDETFKSLEDFFFKGPVEDEETKEFRVFRIASFITELTGLSETREEGSKEISEDFASVSDEALDSNLSTQDIILPEEKLEELKKEIPLPEGENIITVDKEKSFYEEDKPLPITSNWGYEPVPEGPDMHEEFDCRWQDITKKFKLIGARGRGKKHKHEATNCDDWFEFSKSNGWTIIAVSDGAGSHVYSRVGAKVSCQTAVDYLSKELKDHLIKEREDWSRETFKRDEQTGSFAEEDIEFVQKKLHEGIKKAYETVVAAALERENNPDYFNSLGRKLNLRDLSATLLVAVHTTVKYKDKDYSFGLTCQVGDGMTASVDTTGNLRLLGIPDSGEFSGETDFLTTKEKLEPENLMRKTFPYFWPIRALMIMTDGVADDYFPNDPGLLRLYGDLVLNGIIDIKGIDKEEIEKALSVTKLTTLEEVKKADYHNDGEQITKHGAFRIPVQSADKFAEKLGLSLQDLIKSPSLLLAGRKKLVGIKEEAGPEEKLRYWLDSYYVRGSFDDRTLVVLYREEDIL